MQHRIEPHVPAVVLAPMEGVTDAPMRALLASLGGLSLCVSEFVRISQQVLSRRSLLAHVPELVDCGPGGPTTARGVPVLVQLLGGDAGRMAASAAEAIAAGAQGIDLNFGCPARTVNRHDGGAALLRAPERIRAITAAVRAAVPAALPVSAKLRLGWDDPNDIFENAEAAAAGGASWLTIHGRTRAQGYRPPAYWRPIGAVRAQLGGLPVVANGDIWTVQDARRCIEESGCCHLMLGRGAVADPGLPAQVARLLGTPIATSSAPEPDFAAAAPPDACDWPALLRAFVALSVRPGQSPRFLPGRLKQWGKMVHHQRPGLWYPRMRMLEDTAAILAEVDAWAAEAGAQPQPASAA